jgi:hypothetical protein
VEAQDLLLHVAATASLVIETPHKVGGLFRTSTRPTFNLHLLLRASVSAFPSKVSHAPISVPLLVINDPPLGAWGDPAWALCEGLAWRSRHSLSCWSDSPWRCGMWRMS